MKIYTHLPKLTNNFAIFYYIMFLRLSQIVVKFITALKGDEFHIFAKNPINLTSSRYVNKVIIRMDNMRDVFLGEVAT